MKNVIEFRKINHSYGEKKVLNDLTFSVGEGSVLGLLGKNGAGKTTTINILMGFLTPDSGRAEIFGEPAGLISPQTRKRIGLLHEGFLQYDFMTIEQAERFYSGFYEKWKKDLYYGLIDRMGLKYNHQISKMSCGQRSQVTLGLILAQDSDLLILDDYSLGLDPGYRRLFIDFLGEHVRSQRKTLLVTSHIVQDLEKIVDEVIVIDSGRALVNMPLAGLQDGFRMFSYLKMDGEPDAPKDDVVYASESVGARACVYTFRKGDEVMKRLKNNGISCRSFAENPMTLEDTFIGLTGKY